MTAVAVSPSGRHVASGGEDTTVRLFEMRSRRCLEVLAGHGAEITALAFTPDARYLLSASRDQSVRVWDLEKGACARTLPHPAPVLGLSLHPRGHLAFSGGADRLIRIWHLDWEPGAAKGPAWDEAKEPTPSHWDEVRRSTPVVATIRPSPVVARVVRGFPWRRIALGLVVLGAIALGVSSWIKPRVALRVVPYMAKTVLEELDPIDLGAFSEPCSEPRDAYRERARAREVSAPTLSCLARTNEPGVVAEYLAEAPLADPDDPLRDQRLFRNAVSLMLGLGDAATEPLCGSLGDARERVRRIAGVALARRAKPAATACLRRALAEGDALSRATAASVLDILLANREVGGSEGFALAQSLGPGRGSHDPEPRRPHLRHVQRGLRRSRRPGRHLRPGPDRRPGGQGDAGRDRGDPEGGCPALGVLRRA